MKTKKNKAAATGGFTGYTDAPPAIGKELEGAKRVKDFLPIPEKLKPKTVTGKEQKLTAEAWQRYRIKDHERGHRKALSKILEEPTRRLDTSILLPEKVYNWVKGKPNKAAFIRDTLIKQFKQTA
jgi:hypothetical protein